MVAAVITTTATITTWVRTDPAAVSSRAERNAARRPSPRRPLSITACCW